MAQHGMQLITTDFKLYHSVWRHSVLIQAYLFKNAARFTQIHAQCSKRKTENIFDLYFYSKQSYRRTWRLAVSEWEECKLIRGW